MRKGGKGVIKCLRWDLFVSTIPFQPSQEAKTLYHTSQQGVLVRIGWQQCRVGSAVVSYGIGDETQLAVGCACIGVSA